MYHQFQRRHCSMHRRSPHRRCLIYHRSPCFRPGRSIHPRRPCFHRWPCSRPRPPCSRPRPPCFRPRRSNFRRSPCSRPRLPCLRRATCFHPRPPCFRHLASLRPRHRRCRLGCSLRFHKRSEERILSPVCAASCGSFALQLLFACLWAQQSSFPCDFQLQIHPRAPRCAIPVRMQNSPSWGKPGEPDALINQQRIGAARSETYHYFDHHPPAPSASISSS
jgi:hypothetical protein